MPNKEKGFSQSILLIAVLAVLVGGGAYLLFRGSVEPSTSSTSQSGPAFVDEENVSLLLMTLDQARAAEPTFADSGAIPVRDITDPIDLTFGDYTAPNAETDVVAIRGMAVEFVNAQDGNERLQQRVYWFATAEDAAAAYGQAEKKFDARFVAVRYDFSKPRVVLLGDEAKRHVADGLITRNDVLIVRQRNTVHVVHVAAGPERSDALVQEAGAILEENFLSVPEAAP